MILVYKQFYANTTSLPLQWVLSSSNACGSAEEISGTSDTGYIDLTLRLQNEECFNNVEYTLVTIDSCNRTVTNTFVPVNNCGQWSVVLTNNGSFGFNAEVIGSGSYTYEWDFNHDVFELAPTDDSANGFLDLILKDGHTTHDSEVITVTVQNSNGCTQEEHIVFEPCRATPINENLVMSCVKLSESPQGTTGVINKQTQEFRLRFATCFLRGIDWSTLEFSNVPQNMFPVHLGNGSVIIYANTQYNLNVSPLIKARVKDSDGVWSDYLNIAITVPLCVGDVSPITIDENYVFEPGEAGVGEVAYMALEPLVASDETLDWSTFTFVAGAYQTLNSATDIDTSFANATLGIDRKIRYEITAVPTDDCVDIIKWRIADVNGKYSKEGRTYWDYTVSIAPTTVADTACVVCGDTVTLQPLTNDTGIIDPDSFNVTASPTKGNYQWNNPDLSYTAFRQSTGSDTITYTVSNPDGVASNASNITISIVCPGSDNSTTECVNTVVDFTDFLSPYATAGGSWSQDGSNPDTVSLGTPTAVDFTGKTPGTYLFYYSVTSTSCSDSMTLTVNLRANSVNDDCGDAITMMFPTANTVQGEILSCDTDYTLESSPSTVQNPTTWPAAVSRSADVFYEFDTTLSSTSGYVTVDGTPYGAEGIFNPLIAIYSGGCTVDTFSIEAQGAKSDGSQKLVLAFEGFTASTHYIIRVASGTYGGSASGGIGRFNIKLEGI